MGRGKGTEPGSSQGKVHGEGVIVMSRAGETLSACQNAKQMARREHGDGDQQRARDESKVGQDGMAAAEIER